MHIMKKLYLDFIFLHPSFCFNSIYLLFMKSPNLWFLNYPPLYWMLLLRFLLFSPPFNAVFWGGILGCCFASHSLWSIHPLLWFQYCVHVTWRPPFQHVFPSELLHLHTPCTDGWNTCSQTDVGSLCSYLAYLIQKIVSSSTKFLKLELWRLFYTSHRCIQLTINNHKFSLNNTSAIGLLENSFGCP